MVKSGGLLLGLRHCIELEKTFLKVGSGEEGRVDRVGETE